jgi:hypothetical protein
MWCAKGYEIPNAMLRNYMNQLDVTGNSDFGMLSLLLLLLFLLLFLTSDFSSASWVDYKDFGLILSAFQYDRFLRALLMRDVDGSQVLEPCSRVVKSHRELRKLVVNSVSNCMQSSFLFNCLVWVHLLLLIY